MKKAEQGIFAVLDRELEMLNDEIKVDVQVETEEDIDEDDISRIRHQKETAQRDLVRESQLELLEQKLKEKLKEIKDTQDAEMIANRINDFITAVSENKNGLKAIRTREIEELRLTVNQLDQKDIILTLQKYTDSPGAQKLAMDLETLRARAVTMLAKFDEVLFMRREIENIDQAVIAEIRSFSDPPEFVCDVMTALYTLLGESEEDVKDWTKIRLLIGKLGKLALRRRVLEFDMNSLDGKYGRVKRAKKLIANQSLADAKEVSVGATVFFSWCKVTIDTFETTF